MSLEELKDKYDEIVEQTLARNKSILIESFVEYYGEEYRDIIERKYNEIVFVYYIDWEEIGLLGYRLSKTILNTKGAEQLKDLNAFLKCKDKTPWISKLFNRNKMDFLDEVLVGTTSREIINNEYIRNRISKHIKYSKRFNVNFGIYKTNRVVCFPILSIPERCVIHEINHALTREFLTTIKDEQNSIGSIEKLGLITYINGNSEEIILEELLNDKASFEIFDIFKRRGGDLSAFCITNPQEYPYEHNFYLINDFYEAFKKYIKKARMGENINILISRIGEQLYKQYESLVRYRYSSDLDQIPGIKKNTEPRIKELVKEMKTNESNSHELTREELESYYNELRSLGHNVRVLNDLPDNDFSNLESQEIRRK